jgi:hypothetical protein
MVWERGKQIERAAITGADRVLSGDRSRFSVELVRYFVLRTLREQRSLNFFIVGQYESEIALQEQIWFGVVRSPI